MSTTISDTHAADAVDVILRDGSHPAPAPAGHRRRGRGPSTSSTRLSEQSLYLRFHGIQRIGDELVAHFLDPDWQTTAR